MALEGKLQNQDKVVGGTMTFEGECWPLLQRLVFWLIAGTIIIIEYFYAFHMSRPIVFDEIGLFNPIYTYLTTGHMTYPMHGFPDFMVVHPPVHYMITAWMMELGLPLFQASTVGLLLLTFVTILLLATGGFRFFVAISAILAMFTANWIWGETYTVRPDMMVTSTWFAGLIAFQAAENRQWSEWRLFLGAALSMLAPTMHYWGIAALATPAVYGAVLIAQYRGALRSLMRPLLAIVAGSLVIAVPYLVLFIVPYHHAIRAMIDAVQGNKGIADAYLRHIQSYSLFAQRLTYSFSSRWLSDMMVSPVLNFGIPAVFVASPLLLIWRGTRTLAVAGAALPLFVLLFSQGKQVGYTGYFTPEMAIYFFAIFALVLGSLQWIITSVLRLQRGVNVIVQGGVATLIWGGLVSCQPINMAQPPADKWVQELNSLDIVRAAARMIVGDGALVGVLSAGNWYTGGGHYVWNALNELAGLNRDGGDVAKYLSPIDALVVDSAYWDYTSSVAPAWDWYRIGLLQLRGFVFPMGIDHELMELFLSSKQTGPRSGFLLARGNASEFTENSSGAYVMEVSFCQEPPEYLEAARLRYYYALAYASVPTTRSPTVVLMVGHRSDIEQAERSLNKNCVMRDKLVGDLTAVDQQTLSPASDVRSGPIQFFMSRSAALAAAGRSSTADLSADQYSTDRFDLRSPEVDLRSYVRIRGARAIPCPDMCFAGQDGRWGFQAALDFAAFEGLSEASYIRLGVRVRHGTLAVSIYDNSGDHITPLRLPAAAKPYDVLIPIAKPQDLSHDHPVGFSTYGDEPTVDFDILQMERYSHIERRR